MNLVQIEVPQTPAADPPWYHVIWGDQPVLLLVERSRVYALSPELAAECEADEKVITALRAAEVGPAIRVACHPTAISLNIAQSCNLSCAYCYADEGRFGAAPRMMTQDTAIRSIRRLFDTVSSRTVSIGFIGGEPLLNRAVLHAAVEYAATEAQQRGASVTFGITTNGTMLRASDLQLFRSSPFAVTVSLDGGQSVNDALRRPRGRSSGFAEVVRRIRPLLADPGQARVAVRATVTRVNLQVTECVEALAAQGFQEVGISPLRTGPQRDLVLRGRDWDVLLHEMKLLGAREFARVKMGGQFRFSNLAAALKQIHRGASKALPCGSATNYLSVDAGGDYYSCHRTVGSAAFFLGSAETGPSLAARERFATARHVDHQTPCRECWARYLCGGGCHVEVLAGGREGCDYIRGWLEFVISLYPQVLAERPDLLEGVAD